MKNNSQPRKSAAKVALIIIDMMNGIRRSRRAVRECAACCQANRRFEKKAHKSQVPVIYANDNFGHWRSDLRQAVEHCLHDGVRGAKLAETLLPDAEACGSEFCEPEMKVPNSSMAGVVLRR